MWQLRNTSHRRRHGTPDRRIAELAGTRVKDDLIGITGLGGEAVLEHLLSLLRWRARKREVVYVSAAELSHQEA